MNFLRFLLPVLLILFSNQVLAAETIAGQGAPYTARLVFQKKDVNKVSTNAANDVILQSGDELLPAKQQNSSLPVFLIPSVKSNGWCDPAANPNVTTTAIDQCYGWSQQSQWFLLDFSKLGKRKLLLNITLQKSDTSTNNPLVPALTIWRGQQTQGLAGDWYPNKFQGFGSNGKPDNSVAKAFWAWNLAPLNNTSGKLSWVTASGSSNKDKASFSQTIALKGGESNYLSVIVGSDNQETPNQNADFKLVVRLSQTKSGNTPPPDPIDKYGCTRGLTCWHPQHLHCMAVAECSKPEFAGQCLCGN